MQHKDVIEETRALLARGVPGPWTARYSSVHAPEALDGIVCMSVRGRDIGGRSTAHNDTTAALIAAAPRLLASLVAELEAARAVVEWGREVAHGCLVRIDGKRCMRCKACRFAGALKTYDAAKAGKAVE